MRQRTKTRRWRERGQDAGHTMPRMVSIMRTEMSAESEGALEDQIGLAEHCYFSAAIENKRWEPSADGLTEQHFPTLGPLFRLFTQFTRNGGHVPSVEIVQRSFPIFEFYGGSNPSWASDILHREEQVRRIQKHLRQAAAGLQDRDMDAAMHALREATTVNTGATPVGKFLEDIEEAEARPKLPPVYDTIAQCGGIPANSYVVVVARLSVGKSWRLAQHGAAAAIHGWPVVHFAMEETRTAVGNRIATLLTPGGYPAPDDEAAWGAMQERRRRAAERIKQAGGSYRIVDSSDGPVTPESIVRGTYPGCLVIVDYLGLMRSNGGKRMSEDWTVATDVSNTLRELTVAHDVTVIAGAQANRSTGKGSPDDTNIALADAIGQDVDMAITLTREKDCPVTKNTVIKSRHGSVNHGRWFSRMEPDNGDFAPLSYEEGLAAIRDYEIDKNIQGGM